MKKYFALFLILASCSKTTPPSHLISLQMIDRNGQTETISQTERIKLLEKQDFSKPQPYEKILRVYSKNDEGKNPSVLTTYHKNGQLFQKLEALDGRAFGNYYEYYETGVLRILSKVIEGTADLTNLAQSSWVFDGPCTIYYPSGQIQAEFTYDRGKKTKEGRYYFANGALQKKIQFVDDLAEGLIEEFNPNQTISQTFTFLAGKQHGTSIKYHKDASCAFEENWENDRLIEGRYYDLKGALISEIKQGTGLKTLYEDHKITSNITYNKGTPEGKITFFDSQGFPVSSYHIKDNQKYGEETVYYEGTHVIKMQLDWQEDAISGLVKTFYKDGTLESQKTFSMNKKNGPATIFYPTGDLMMLETYSQDRLVEGKYYKKGDKQPSSSVEDGTGKVTFFDEWGAIKQEILYEKGKVVLEDD